MASVVRLTKWRLDYIVWGVSWRAVICLAEGMAETMASLEELTD